MDSISTTIEYTINCDSGAHYAAYFRCDEQTVLFGNKFTGSIKNHIVKGTLSDGTEGYKYIMCQIPHDATLDMYIYFLDEYNNKPKKYTINLKDFK